MQKFEYNEEVSSHGDSSIDLKDYSICSDGKIERPGDVAVGVVCGCQSSEQANGANDDMIAIKDIILNLLELSIEVEVSYRQQIDYDAQQVEYLQNRDEGKDRLIAFLLLLPDLGAGDCDDEPEDHGFERGEGYGDCLRLRHVD